MSRSSRRTARGPVSEGAFEIAIKQCARGADSESVALGGWLPWGWSNSHLTWDSMHAAPSRPPPPREAWSPLERPQAPHSLWLKRQRPPSSAPQRPQHGSCLTLQCVWLVGGQLTRKCQWLEVSTSIAGFDFQVKAGPSTHSPIWSGLQPLFLWLGRLTWAPLLSSSFTVRMSPFSAA